MNRNQYGENKLTPPQKTPLYIKFLMQFTNFFSLLLLAGSILCFIGYSIDPDKDQTNLYLGIVLGMVVLITCTFSFYQEAQSDSIMESFKNMIPRKCKVIRTTGTAIVDATEVVKGDLVELGEGDQVPADVRVIDATEVSVLLVSVCIDISLTFPIVTCGQLESYGRSRTTTKNCRH